MELGTLDLVVFSAVLLISFAIGVYYAYRGKGNTSDEEYFVASRNMNVFAASCSAFASAFSGLGPFILPNDTYFRGPGMWYASIISNTVESIMLVLIFVPIYHRLRLTNVYDYLGMRFSSTVKYIAVVIQVTYILFHMGICIYSPSLALSSVFGININASILLIGGICLIYTAIGGMRAVIWNDVFQSVVIVTGTIALCVLVIPSGDGVGNVFRTAYQDGRGVQIDTSFDVTVPYTLWSSIFTIPFAQLTRSAVGQYHVQRYFVVRTLNEARVTAISGQFLNVLVLCLYIFVGLVMYTFYAGCDPLTIGIIEKKDQTFPLFLAEIFQQYNGVIGLIIAVVLSGILSTVSSGVNSLGAMTYKELGRVFLKNPTPAHKMYFTKTVTAILGCVVLVAALLGRYIGNILEAIQIWTGIFIGPVLAVFILGMISRKASPTGALAGIIAGLCTGIWIKLGSRFYPFPRRALPLYTDQCNITEIIPPVNMTDPVSTIPNEDTGVPFSIYHISSTYYCIVTCIATWLVAIFVSLFTKPKNGTILNEDLFVHPGRLFSNSGKPSKGNSDEETTAEEKL
ncbi:Sodium-coupled monocarboxylate transporter 1 [Holothuria leucospilota]|uniref:Sodium-coupled monocarboxylate transporter 1 n=1 Tax=Holothuria leucospilota TaxID=206669 RepID=A0A9Q0YI42_HOLLE|nr:Sodium-coupled monocarboxylate transporter 1 [Holothuria leucospilota]